MQQNKHDDADEQNRNSAMKHEIIFTWSNSNKIIKRMLTNVINTLLWNVMWLSHNIILIKQIELNDDNRHSGMK